VNATLGVRKIHLDANYLIGAVSGRSPIESRLLNWLRDGEDFSISSIAWTECLNGPINAVQEEQIELLVQGRIIPFARAEGVIAARLFNGTGRRRGSQPDCFIAATAMRAGCPLATENRRDFLPFVPAGLRLA
jgi:predicted nucleic acid-binding protein